MVFINSHTKNNSETKIFEIKKGENAFAVGKKLEKEELINSRWNFVWNIYKSHKQKKIKAGKYELSNKLRVADIISIITDDKNGKAYEQVKVTFPEGWTSAQMAKRLGEKGFSEKEFLELVKKPKYFEEKYQFDFLDSVPQDKTLEGFLFPDTYFFDKSYSTEKIIKKMLDNFNLKLSDDLRAEIKRQNKTIYEIVTMASILEKEVRTEKDKKIVSGIFWNRLKSGQAFQSCATLAYILGENKKQYSYEDTKIESPYNTYLYPGLPPGPISNPGLDSILAAIYPAETNFNYFLSNPETGETVFSKTLDEHNLNKVRNGL